MNMIKEIIMAMMIIIGLLLMALTGCVPNIVAYDYDDQIDYATIYFGDGTNATIAEDGLYNLTVNQTSIIGFYVYSDFIYTYTANTTYSEMVSIVITSPSGQSTYLYATPYGEWALEPVGSTYYIRGALTNNEAYNITRDGLYSIEMEHWMIVNGTVTNSDDYDFGLSSGGSVASGVLFMGDWEFFEMSMGMIGVIGFAATPFVAAKLGSSRDPMVVISAFLICMIMFGTFIYVFLLGGG